MRAVVTVIGRDMVGILAKVSALCAGANANILEVTQTVLQELFAMIMLVDIERLGCDYAEFQATLQKAGDEIGLSVSVMHEDIFNSMHRI